MLRLPLLTALGTVVFATFAHAQTPARTPPHPKDWARPFPAELIPTTVEPSAPPFQWHVPGAIEDVPMSGEAESLGVPVRAHAVRSKERIEPLYLHFLQAFRRAGLYLPPPSAQFHMKGGLALTAIDDERMISYTVIFQANADRTTTVILGEANLAARRPAAEDAQGGLPLPPQAKRVVRARSEGTSQVTFRLRARADEVTGYYRDVLGANGFEETEPQVFSDGTRQVQVLTQQVTDDEVVVALVERPLR